MSSKISEILHNELEKFRASKQIILKDFLNRTEISQGAYYSLKNEPYEKESRIKKVVDKVSLAFPEFSFDIYAQHNNDVDEITKEVLQIIEKWDFYSKNSTLFAEFIDGKITKGVLIELRKVLLEQQKMS